MYIPTYTLWSSFHRFRSCPHSIDTSWGKTCRETRIAILKEYFNQVISFRCERCPLLNITYWIIIMLPTTTMAILDFVKFIELSWIYIVIKENTKDISKRNRRININFFLQILNTFQIVIGLFCIKGHPNPKCKHYNITVKNQTSITFIFRNRMLGDKYVANKQG